MKVAIFLCLCLLAVSVRSEDHLVPDLPFLVGADGYSLAVREVFDKGFDGNVVARVFINPSFGEEKLIGLRKDKDNYSVFLMTPTSSIKNDFISQAKEGVDYKKYGMKLVERSISNRVAARIENVWRNQILKSAYGQPPGILLDGTSYNFSMFAKGYGEIGGRVGSSQVGEKTGILLKLVEGIEKYILNSRETESGDIEQYLSAIE